MMKFRKAVKNDAKDIFEIIEKAKIYFKNNNINQWQGPYPSIETVYEDINNQNSYVLSIDKKIVGISAILFDDDKNYKIIKNGKWLTNGRYATIHRIATDTEYKNKGIASNIIKFTEQLCRQNNIRSIRIDTHVENIAMRSLIEKNDFKYCGIVNVEDGTQRLAFEKIVIEMEN